MAIDFGPLQRACRDTFGETVSYTPNGGSAVSVKGIWNILSQELSDGLPVIAHRPNLGIKTGDLVAAPKVGDAVTVRAVAYKVANVEDDGEGMHVLYLHKAT